MDKDILMLRLNEKWGCSLACGWIPIRGSETIPNTEIYDANYFNHFTEDIKAAIKSIYDLTSVFEIREDGRLKELTINECDFSCDGLEYIYTDGKLNFVHYCSHEASTTVGGALSIAEIHQI